MIATRAPSTDVTRDIPATLQSPRAKLVYLYLTQGEASVDTLRAELDISKISLYPILQTLDSHGLVERADGETFRCCEDTLLTGKATT